MGAGELGERGDHPLGLPQVGHFYLLSLHSPCRTRDTRQATRHGPVTGRKRLGCTTPVYTWGERQKRVGPC